MAIYHLTATVISRGRGQSAVSAAAYRAGTTLRDERYGVTHQYAGKHGGVHAEIVAPPGAPAWVHDREVLWNRVEARELRKDSQLARLIEVGLPVELSCSERTALVRDYAGRQFASRGMVADIFIRGDGTNPVAHIMLTLRGATVSGFGPKRRDWNGKAVLLVWRAAWAEIVNLHLAQAGHAVRIDHRTLEAQQIDLAPGRRIGPHASRPGDRSLPVHLAERLDEQRRIRHDNGAAVIRDATVALRAVTHQRPAFTREELVRFLRYRTADEDQLEHAVSAVMESEECVPLPARGEGPARFTSRDMMDAEASLMRRAAVMAGRRGHGVGRHLECDAALRYGLNESQRRAFEYVVGEGDAKAVAVAGSMKHALIAASRHAWEEEGFSVLGAEWRSGEDVTTRTVVLVETPQAMGLKELEQIMAVADHARAKAVLIGDLDEVESMKAATPFQALLRQVGPPFQR